MSFVMVSQYTADEENRLVLKGYQVLYQNKIGPQLFRDRVVPVVEELQRMISTICGEFRCTVLVKEKVDEAQTKLSRDFFNRSAYAPPLKEIAALFPVSDAMQQAYADMWSAGEKESWVKTLFLQRAQAVRQAMRGEVDAVLRPVPPETEWKGFWTMIRLVPLAFVSMLLWGTWWTYLTIMRRGRLRPWQVRWSVFTCLIAAFWSVPIAATSFGAGLWRGGRWLGKIVWAIVSGDLGRVVNTVRGKEVEVFRATARDEALTLLYTRTGAIVHDLTELQLKRVEEQTDRFDWRIEQLERERDEIDQRVGRLRADEGQAPEVFGPEEPDVVTSTSTFRERYEALCIIDPTIPKLARQEQ